MRKRRILTISLLEHIRLERNVNTFDNRKHGRDEIDVVTCQKKVNMPVTLTICTDFRSFIPS